MDEALKENLFKKLCSLLLTYEDEGLEVRKDTEREYHLYGKKTVKIGKSEYEGLYFASAVIQKNFTGFYFFPIYTHAEEFDDTPEELRKCLKGKSCFHIKKDDPLLFQQIENILNKGFRFYKKENLI